MRDRAKDSFSLRRGTALCLDLFFRAPPLSSQRRHKHPRDRVRPPSSLFLSSCRKPSDLKPVRDFLSTLRDAKLSCRKAERGLSQLRLFSRKETSMRFPKRRGRGAFLKPFSCSSVLSPSAPRSCTWGLFEGPGFSSSTSFPVWGLLSGPLRSLGDTPF